MESLTKPNPRLAETKWINFVMGVLPGWWLGAADARFPEPYMDSARWDTALRAAGFAGAEAVAYDGYLNNNIITTPQQPSPSQKRITLLHGGDTTTIAPLLTQLHRAGYQIDLHTLDTLLDTTTTTSNPNPNPGPSFSLPANQTILTTLDLSSPFFHALTSPRLAAFQALVRHARDGGCGVLWLTGASQVRCVDPRFAPVVGVARVLRTETGVDFGTVELERDFLGRAGQVHGEGGDGDGGDGGGVVDGREGVDGVGGVKGWDLSAVPAVLEEFQRRERDGEEGDVRAEAEWACVGGRVLVGRYHFVDVVKGIVGDAAAVDDGEGRPPAEKTVLKLEQHRPGLVNTLFWERRAETALGENDVRVEVQAVGLNFKVNTASSFPPVYFFDFSFFPFELFAY